MSAILLIIEGYLSKFIKSISIPSTDSHLCTFVKAFINPLIVSCFESASIIVNFSFSVMSFLIVAVLNFSIFQKSKSGILDSRFDIKCCDVKSS